MADSLIGKTIGKYQIVEHLGRGGMAEVYKAYQPALDRYVAIKLMHSYLAEDKNFLSRFQREAKAVAPLRHPNIVQLYDFDVAGGVYYYMVMEFIDGYTLKTKLQELEDRGEIMPLDETIRVVRDVASALSYAHNRGMVHRDIKPSNIMIDLENRVILTDFGIAKMLSSPQYTTLGGMTGTPSYVSPEQGLGEPGDIRSDIYSLGTMFFQMVTGRLPYEADSAMAVVLKHINDPLPIPSQFNPALPPAIDRCVLKAMAKNPNDRYQTTDEFVLHLEQVSAAIALSEAAVPATMITDSTEQAAAVFSSDSPAMPVERVGALADVVHLPPYILSPSQIAQDPSELPAVCDADWNRAVDHFARGYLTQWMREGVDRLRTAYQHGLADGLELVVIRGEAIVQRIQDGDDIARNAGLEEFLELLGATLPLMDITPPRLILPTVGVGETGQPVTLTITNKDRGYLFGVAASQVPWLKVTPDCFGCAAGEHCAITVEPDLSGLPAGRIQSSEGLYVRSIGGDQHLAVQVDILPSALQLDDSTLDFGAVGQGEAAQKTFTLRNGGRGYLIGQVRCRAPWLTASPEQFRVPAGDSLTVTVRADSQSLPPGDATHTWALVVESNGGHAVLGVQMRVLSPRLEIEPSQIDLGAIDLARPGATKSAELTIRNTGPGVLTGVVTVGTDWPAIEIEPAAFRCRAGEAQQVRLSTAELKVGKYRHTMRVLSNAGEVETAILLQVSFSLEPEMVHIPAGEFLRGSKESVRLAPESEKPQQQIYLDEYRIGKYPVTNAQYAVFVAATGRRFPEHWEDKSPPEDQKDHPVVNVSWRDAAAYCHWLAQVTGKPYRLPTEAQWEKAARSTDGRVYPWGIKWDSKKCNAGEGGKRGTTPVGAYSPAGNSPYGCADVAGNVLEWVADWYAADYYARSAVAQNPYGPVSGAVKVLRGGSWRATARRVRCAGRFNANPRLTSPEAGFRCALW